MAPGFGVCAVAVGKAGLKPDTFDGGGRGGREAGFAPGGGGYDMMNFAVRPRLYWVLSAQHVPDESSSLSETMGLWVQILSESTVGFKGAPCREESYDSVNLECEIVFVDGNGVEVATGSGGARRLIGKYAG